MSLLERFVTTVATAFDAIRHVVKTAGSYDSNRLTNNDNVIFSKKDKIDVNGSDSQEVSKNSNTAALNVWLQLDTFYKRIYIKPNCLIRLQLNTFKAGDGYHPQLSVAFLATDAS